MIVSCRRQITLLSSEVCPRSPNRLWGQRQNHSVHAEDGIGFLQMDNQLAVPVMAGFLGVERAVMTMVLPILVLNIWLMWTLRDRRNEAPEIRYLLCRLDSEPATLQLIDRLSSAQALAVFERYGFNAAQPGAAVVDEGGESP